MAAAPPEPQANEFATAAIDDALYVPDSLLRQLRDLCAGANGLANWWTLLSALTPIGATLPTGRIRDTLQSVGMPLTAHAPDSMTTDIEQSMMSALLTMGLPAITPQPPGFGIGAWGTAGWTNPIVFKLAAKAQIAARITHWAATHVDTYSALPPPASGGPSNINVAAVATAAATAAAVQSKGEKPIAHASKDGTWPEEDVLACVGDAAFAQAEASIKAADPTDFIKMVTAKDYTTLSAGAQLLVWAFASRTPTLALQQPKLFRNSDERQVLHTTVAQLATLLGKPAQAAFATSMLGVRPPSNIDKRAAWDLASQLDENAWGNSLHVFSSAEEVRAGAVEDIFLYYMAYESCIAGLLTLLAGAFPWLVKVPADTNVLLQHARLTINKPSFVNVSPDVSDRKRQFHEFFVGPVLATMTNNLRTSLDAASAQSSTTALADEHRVVTLATLMHTAKGKDICADAHNFLADPASSVHAVSQLSGATEMRGASPALNAAIDSRVSSGMHAYVRSMSPTAKQAGGSSPLLRTVLCGQLNHSPKRLKLLDGHNATPAAVSFSPSQPAGAAPAPASAPPAADQTETGPTIKPGDASQWYDHYRTRTLEIIHGAGAAHITQVECPAQAYLASKYCANKGRCKGVRRFMHSKDVPDAQLRSHGLNNMNLIMVANEFIDSHDRLPPNFALPLLRPVIAKSLKMQRGG